MRAGAPGSMARRLETHVRYLAGELGERNVLYHSRLEDAARYIRCHLAQAGLDAREEVFEVAGRPFRNVWAEEPGHDPSGGLLVVGAHYDTAEGTPGADDNASGVAVLLELARLLRGSSPRLGLRWVAFALEEPPHFRTLSMGSRIHARACRRRGDPVWGMLSLEMLGYFRDGAGSQGYPLPLMRWFYPEEGNFIAVAGNFRSRRLVRQIARRLAASGTIPVESTALPLVPGAGLSDNWSFWQEGYRAAMVTDTAFFRNPHYHRPSDLADTLDFTRMSALLQALAAALPRCR